MRVKITEKLSELGDIIQEVKKSSEDIGAILVFIGVVRGSSPLGKVLRLEYEVHEKLAYKKLEEIAKNVKERYSVIDIVIEHRKGSVNRGENIMYVVVASKHRKEGFEALMEIINRLKEEVPIWKKEVTEHGYRWVEG